MVLTETLTKALKLFPQKRAIVCGGKHWTYQEFCSRVHQLARCLKGFGLKKDDKVAILHPNCHTFLEAYYAIPQIGAISVPINTRLSPREIAFILQDSESKILIADSMFKNQLDPIRKEIRGIKQILWTGEDQGDSSPPDSPPKTSARGRTRRNHSIDLNYEKALQQEDVGALPAPPLTVRISRRFIIRAARQAAPKG